MSILFYNLGHWLVTILTYFLLFFAIVHFPDHLECLHGVAYKQNGQTCPLELRKAHLAYDQVENQLVDQGQVLVVRQLAWQLVLKSHVLHSLVED